MLLLVLLMMVVDSADGVDNFNGVRVWLVFVSVKVGRMREGGNRN